MSNEVHVVTGAFGYSGQYIAHRLLEKGVEVRTLTNSPNRANPFGGAVQAFPYSFDEPRRLAEALEGASVLYNTYWVRFNHKTFTHAEAVKNTLALFEAAKAAGVQRVVHVSIANASEDSPIEYFRCKAKLERALKESGLSHAILRPAILFGKEDILVNNIAWALRRMPVFGVFGNGHYRLQPIYVDDLAKLAVEQGERRDNRIIDAIGPETFTYRGLVEAVAHAIGVKRWIMSVPPSIGFLAAAAMGKLVNDVILTRDEVAGLMAGLLCTDSPPAGATALTAWAREHADTLGRRYASELARRRDRQRPYM